MEFNASKIDDKDLELYKKMGIYSDERKDVKPEYVYIDYLELIKGETLFDELRELCNELEIAVMVLSTAPSKSDYSEYKEERFNKVDHFMIMNDESIISMD